MKKALISFAICAVLGFGLGYLVFDVIMGNSNNEPKVAQADKQTKTKTTTATKEESTETKQAEPTTVAASDDNILNKKGCLQCHSVESLKIQAGAVGPDLSKAYINVEGKHGKPIEEFLKKPTSQVMSGVIGKNPLTDDERKQVLQLLKEASEK
ncbi:hypothetical protein [Bacillus rubiinfantis]|uniref:hypothetical protein n=1 Tax=Bacillus rubiinfantis TaxID=1499680 RepID=UPI0005A9BA3C|nr:hypothetical protein [Bacillus rubiinfantis]